MSATRFRIFGGIEIALVMPVSAERLFTGPRNLANRLPGREVDEVHLTASKTAYRRVRIGVVTRDFFNQNAVYR
jgi:hypothetical protein